MVNLGAAVQLVPFGNLGFGRVVLGCFLCSCAVQFCLEPFIVVNGAYFCFFRAVVVLWWGKV